MTSASACGRSARLGRDDHDVGAVHLVEVAEPVARREVGEQQAVVLRLASRVVAGHERG